MHLASTVFPGPGLTCLEHEYYFGKVSDVASAAMLARAVATHTTLTRLNAPLMMPAAVAAFGAALPSTPPVPLRVLELYTAANPAGVTAIAEVLRKSSLLESAKVVFQHWDVDSIDCSASTVADTLQTLARYATHPVLLPKLTDIDLYEVDCVKSASDCDSKSRAPELLSVIYAPALTCIWLKHDKGVMEMNVLLATLSRFSGLKELGIRTEVHPDQKGLLQPSACGSKHSLPSLQLRAVEVVGTHACVPLRTAATAARASQQTLTRLVVSRDSPRGGGILRVGVDAAKAAFMGLMATVRGCVQLRDLEIGWLCGVPTGERSPVMLSSAMSECLQNLPQLTRLVLEGQQVHYSGVFGDPVPCKLDGSALVPGIRALTALRQLKICHGLGKVSIENSEDVLRACCACTGLKELWLCVDGLSRERVHAAAVELRHMTRLVLPRQVFKKFPDNILEDSESIEELRTARCDRAAAKGGEIAECKLHLADAITGHIGVTHLPATSYAI